MAKYFVSFLLIFCCSKILISANLYVKVNTDECVSCYAGFSILENLEKSVNIYLVFKETQKKPQRFIENYLPEIKFRYVVVVSDSIYSLLNKGFETECNFTTNFDEVIYSFKLKNISDYIDKINTYVPKTIILRETILPDSLYFPRGATLKLATSGILLYEIDNSNCYLLDKENYSVVCSFSFSEDDYSKIREEILSSQQLELFEKYKDEVSKYFSVSPSISGVSEMDSVIYFYITVPYMRLDGENSVSISRASVLVSRNNDQLNVLKIEDINSYWLMDYKLDIYKDNFIFPIITTEENPTHYIMGLYRILDNQLHFQSFIPVNLPNFYIENKLYYDLLNFWLVEDLVFFNYAPEFYNIRTDSTYQLPFSTNGFSFDRNTYQRTYSYYLVTSFAYRDQIFLIHKQNGVNYISRSNSTCDFLVTSKIEFLDTNFTSNILHLTGNKAIALNSDGEIIEFKIEQP